jgi:hypothetical protein
MQVPVVYGQCGHPPLSSEDSLLPCDVPKKSPTPDRSRPLLRSPCGAGSGSTSKMMEFKLESGASDGKCGNGASPTRKKERVSERLARRLHPISLARRRPFRSSPTLHRTRCTRPGAAGLFDAHSPLPILRTTAGGDDGDRSHRTDHNENYLIREEHRPVQGLRLGSQMSMAAGGLTH